MSKNGWELLNKEDLPRSSSKCANKNQINCKSCVGISLIFKNTNTNQIYKIKIIEYIKGYKENGKMTRPRFKVEYINFKETEYEEVISKSIDCNSLINGANIRGIIPSLNQWRKENDYWIGVTAKGEEFKFSTNNKEIEYCILHSTWNVNNNGKLYAMTGNLNNTGETWQLHQVIAYDGDVKIRQENSNKSMCVDHLNGDSLDNRKENLKIKTIAHNNKNKKTKNELGLTGLEQIKNGKYRSHFRYNGKILNTAYRESLEEAKIDNLIAQRYLGYTHNSELFHLLDNIDEVRIKEVENLVEEKKKKINSVLDLGTRKPIYCEELKQIKLSAKEWGEELKLNESSITKCCKGEYKSTGGYHFRYATEEEIQQYVTINNITKKDEQKEYEYDYIEKNSLIGIRTFKKDGTENSICWVDRDFGEIRGDKYIVNGTIWEDKKYFNYRINRKNHKIHVYIITGRISLQGYRGYKFHTDHKNHNPNDNYRDNLEITTIYSNQYNKEGKGYYKENNKYKVSFGCNWKYFDLYIKDVTKQSIVDTIEEAEEIVKRRRNIINKYRFRVKTLKELDEVIDFAGEHELDLDSAYIVWRGLDSLENIKNFLKTY